VHRPLARAQSSQPIFKNPMNPSDFPTVDVEVDEQQLALERQEKLQALGSALGHQRDEWMTARRTAGVDKRMSDDNDQYHNLDATNKAAGSMMQNVAQGYPSNNPSSKVTRSTLFVGVTRQKTNAAEARLCDIVLPSDDSNFGVDPRPDPKLGKALDDHSPAVGPNGQTPTGKDGQPMKVSDVAQAVQAQAASAAQAMQSEIETQFETCDFYAECRKMIHDSALFGTGVLKGPVVVSTIRRTWKKVTDASGASIYKMQVDYEKSPASYRVDPRKVWPDPACGDDVQSGRGVYEYDDLTTKKLRDLAKQPGYMKDQIRKLLEDGPSKTSKGRPSDFKVSDERLAVSSDSTYSHWTYTGEVSRKALEAAGLPVPEDALDVASMVVELVDDTVVRAYANPLEDGSLPYDFFPWEKVSDSVWGYGVPYLMRAQQQVTNAAWRQIMDNAGISAGPQIVVKPGMVQPADKKWEITARKIWFATDETQDVRTAFTSVQFDSRQQELSAILQMSEKLSDQETATPMMMQGEKGSAPETVGGMQMLMNNTNTVLRRLVKQYDDFVTRRHVRRYYDFNMAYSPKDEIKGDFHVLARGSTALLIRDIQHQALNGLMQVATNPVFAPMIDPKKLFEKALRAQHLDPNDIMRTDQEIQDMQQQAQQHQQPDPRVQAAQIRAQADVQRAQAQSAANAAEIQTRQQMADQDHSARLAELQVMREIEMLKLSTTQNISLEKIKAMLADTALRERTKQQLFAAEAQINAQTGHGI
jgi:hypothetical protein